MHDINFIRDNQISFDNALKQRCEIPISKKIIVLDENKRKTQMSRLLYLSKLDWLSSMN